MEVSKNAQGELTQSSVKVNAKAIS